MAIKNCEENARAYLEGEMNSSPQDRRKVAREMCRLLESGILEKHIDAQPIDLEYLVSRLDIRDGNDNPNLKTKWNYWLGQMSFMFSDKYNRYKV